MVPSLPLVASACLALCTVAFGARVAGAQARVDVPASELERLAAELAIAGTAEARAGLAADYAASAAALARALDRPNPSGAPPDAERVARRRALLNSALARIEPLARELDAGVDPSEVSRETRARLCVQLGTLELERGRLDGDAATFRAAEASFARAADFADEGTPLALRAALGAGEAALASGAPARAVARFAAVAERAVPSDPELWREAAANLTPEERARRYALLELATPGWIAALAADGRVGEACRAGMHWWRTWRGEGLALGAPSGENAAVELARVLVAGAERAAAQGVQHGATLAWREDARSAAWFDDEDAARASGASTLCSPHDFATRVLLAALEARGSEPLAFAALDAATELVLAERVGPDAELTRRLARAAFAAGDWRDAALLFERAAPPSANGARSDLEAERVTRLARCAEELGDPRLAAARFRDVVERHRAAAPWAAESAEGWYRVLSRSEARSPELAEELKAATRAARELASGPIAAEAAFRDAQRMLGEKLFADARAAYALVPPEATPFELAWVHRAVCDYQLGDLIAAERSLGEFLDVRCTDPRHAPADAERADNRRQARAVAELYYGLIAYARAEQAPEHPLEAWQLVRRRLEPYLGRHADQSAFAPLAASRALSACLRMQDFAAAELLEGELFTQFPDSRWSGTAALEMYRERERQRAALGDRDPEQSARLARAMARELEIVNRTAPEPSFANLRAESRAWLELGEWSRARVVLERLVQLFGERERESVEQWILPDLARAWAVDGEPARAAAVLAPLVAARKSAELRRAYARVLGGWCEFGAAAPPTEFAGVGDAASYTRALQLYADLLAGEPRFEASWYAIRYDALYARWRWGATEPRERAAAKHELDALAAELGEAFERLAEPELAARFRWLRSVVR